MNAGLSGQIRKATGKHERGTCFLSIWLEFFSYSHLLDSKKSNETVSGINMNNLISFTTKALRTLNHFLPQFLNVPK